MKNTTYERVERPNLAVLKKDGTRELFDRSKLKRAILFSVGRFLGGDAEVENTVSRIEQKIYDYGENEIKSKQIGDAVMSELAKSNEVAYIRVASVYKKFANADEFVSVYTLPLAEAVQQVLKNEITDGKTVAAILKLKLLRDAKQF